MKTVLDNTKQKQRREREKNWIRSLRPKEQRRNCQCQSDIQTKDNESKVGGNVKGTPSQGVKQREQ